ncbi:MAG TPA: hypothetical protein VFG30_33570 [Polyangiales bacterium]|nr:hypothetical protein [Polyangiales bacterium]
MVRFSAALNRLVEVVAHRVSVGDVLEVRRVAGLDVVKAERTRTLSIDERRWRRVAVAAGADSLLDPGEEIVRTT